MKKKIVFNLLVKVCFIYCEYFFRVKNLNGKFIGLWMIGGLFEWDGGSQCNKF